MNRQRNKENNQPSLLDREGFEYDLLKITALKRQKRGSRLNLEINEEFFCGIDDALVIEFGLHSGKTVTPDLLAKIKTEDDYQKCLKKAYDILAIRLNSEKEIRIKLLKKFEYPTVRKVIERLKELRYINDEYFTKSWVESRERGRGAFVLKRELKQKGINEEVINTEMSLRSKENEFENASELIRKKKYDSLQGQERYKKITGFLGRRGFDYEVIQQVLNNKKTTE